MSLPESPRASEVSRARKNAGLTADQAGNLVAVSGRQWRKYESGQVVMSPALWLLFCISTRQVKPDVR